MIGSGYAHLMQAVAFQHSPRRNEENHDKFEIRSVDSGEGLMCDISG